MKKIAFVFSVLLLLVGCENKPNKNNESKLLTEKNEIDVVLNNWHLNAAETNFDNYFKAMTSESVFVGTDASEVWGKEEFKAFSKPYFDKGSAWSFTAVDRNIYFNNNIELAWFDELLDTWMGVCRGSGVLSKKDGTWKIEHYVLSLTVPNENIKGVIELNKKRDSIFLKKIRK